MKLVIYRNENRDFTLRVEGTQSMYTTGKTPKEALEKFVKEYGDVLTMLIR